MLQRKSKIYLRDIDYNDLSLYLPLKKEDLLKEIKKAFGFNDFTLAESNFTNGLPFKISNYMSIIEVNNICLELSIFQLENDIDDVYLEKLIKHYENHKGNLKEDSLQHFFNFALNTFEIYADNDSDFIEEYYAEELEKLSQTMNNTLFYSIDFENAFSIFLTENYVSCFEKHGDTNISYLYTSRRVV